jgi:hypothetical protein
MKRYGDLWSEVIAFENLLQASKQAQKGKRFRDNVLEFNYNLESELFSLQRDLETMTYQTGEYKTFEIIALCIMPYAISSFRYSIALLSTIAMRTESAKATIAP